MATVILCLHPMYAKVIQQHHYIAKWTYCGSTNAQSCQKHLLQNNSLFKHLTNQVNKNPLPVDTIFTCLTIWYNLNMWLLETVFTKQLCCQVNLSQWKVFDHSFLLYHCSQHWRQWAPCGQNAIECITHNSRPWLALRFSPLLPGSHLSLQESSFLQWCGYFYSSWLVKWEKWRENWLVCHSVVPIRNQWCSLRKCACF